MKDSRVVIWAGALHDDTPAQARHISREVSPELRPRLSSLAPCRAAGGSCSHVHATPCLSIVSWTQLYAQLSWLYHAASPCAVSAAWRSFYVTEQVEGCGCATWRRATSSTTTSRARCC